MQISSHNFVHFCLQTTLTVSKVLRCGYYCFYLCTETHTPDVDTEMMSIDWRSPSLVSTSAGTDHLDDDGPTNVLVTAL